MRIYETRDCAGATCRHFAINPDVAIQAHLVHFGLLGLPRPIEVSEITHPLRDGDVKLVCRDPYCHLANEAYKLQNMKMG